MILQKEISTSEIELAKLQLWDWKSPWPNGFSGVLQELLEAYPPLFASLD